MEEDSTEILIVATAAPSVLTGWKGVAVSVWSLQPPGRDEHGLGLMGQSGTTLSETMESDDKEIALLGLLDALSHVETAQRVRVFINQSWIVDGINGDAERWEAEEWRSRRYANLWKQYLKLCREKSLNVVGEHILSTDPRFASAIRLFRKWAREARNKRASELGAPTAPFDPIED